MAQASSESIIVEALELITMRLDADATIAWLLSGASAQVLQGVELPTPRELYILTGAAEVGRVAALLAADELEPLAMRAAPGFAPSPGGRYEMRLESGASIVVELVGDAQAVGPDGTLSLSLERIWPLRIAFANERFSIALVPLEIELASELLRGHRTEAHAIASFLMARGAQWDRLDPILAQLPKLEDPLWELMDVVRPLAKRARGKRIRRQIGWGGRRR